MVSVPHTGCFSIIHLVVKSFHTGKDILLFYCEVPAYKKEEVVETTSVANDQSYNKKIYVNMRKLFY